MSDASSTPAPAFSRLRITAGVTALLIFVQAGMGIMMFTGNGPGLYSIHGYIGYAAFLVSIVSVVFAWQASAVLGNKGMFFHALSLPILMLVQIALAEMGAGNTVIVVIHIIVGLALLLGAFALFSLAGKRQTGHAAQIVS